MKKLIPFILMPFAAAGQDMVLFDDHGHGHTQYQLRNMGGGELLYSGDGETIEVNPVYTIDVDERVRRGFSKQITPPANSARGTLGTPILIPTYLDVVNGTGKGFDDPALGAQRRAALEAVLSYLAGILDNDGTIDIEIRESFFGSPTSNPFAYSAPYYFGGKGFNQPFPVYHLTTGSDPTSAYPDGYMQFNFSDALNYNLNGNSTTGAAQYDFTTVVLHEMMHVLGFTSYIGETGATQAPVTDAFTSFDAFLMDLNKAPLLTVTGSGASAQVTRPITNNLANNQVWFDLGDGVFAPVYSPSPFSGSSLDHFDKSRNPGADYVMHPSLSRGQQFRLLNDHEVTVLGLLGYDVDHSMATAIDNNTEFEGVDGNLYPNPASHQGPVQINIGKVKEQEILVVVYDMMGRQSYSKVILNQGAGPVTAIDPYNNLAPGMYVVVGSTRDELFNQKLVIR